MLYIGIISLNDVISSFNYSFYQLEFSLFAFGLCKKWSFNSKGDGDIKDNTNKTSNLCVPLQLYGTAASLSSISKLGLKTYENPLESR